MWVLFQDNLGLFWSLPGIMGILYIKETWDPWERGHGTPTHTPFHVLKPPHSTDKED